MMIKKYILASLLATATAAAFSLGSAANVYADNGNNSEYNSRDRVRTDFFRVERKDDNKQIVQVVTPNSTNTNGENGNGNHAAVPEPATMLLIGSAIGGLALLRSRKEMD